MFDRFIKITLRTHSHRIKTLFNKMNKDNQNFRVKGKNREKVLQNETKIAVLVENWTIILLSLCLKGSIARTFCYFLNSDNAQRRKCSAFNRINVNLIRRARTEQTSPHYLPFSTHRIIWKIWNYCFGQSAYFTLFNFRVLLKIVIVLPSKMLYLLHLFVQSITTLLIHLTIKRTRTAFFSVWLCVREVIGTVKDILLSIFGISFFFSWFLINPVGCL